MITPFKENGEVDYDAFVYNVKKWAGTGLEGLLVLGWVALWNPYDRFLFGWLPAVKRRRLVERLLSIEVVVRPMPEELAAALQAGAGQKIRRSRPEQEAGSGR